jgi:hypothetical protein
MVGSRLRRSARLLINHPRLNQERCSRGSVSFPIATGSGGGRLRLPLFGAHDYEPQRDGELAEHSPGKPKSRPSARIVATISR